MQRTVEEEVFLDGLRRIASGKAMSQMLVLALKLDIFAKLKGKSVAVANLGSELSLPAPSARMLTQFLCKEGLVHLRDGKIANAPVVEKFLTGDTVDRRELLMISRVDIPYETLEARLLDPPPLHWHQLRETGEITDASSLVGQKEEGWLARFLSGTNVRRLRWGEELAARYDFGPHRLLLDVGGASGGWCLGIRRSNPHLQCIVFDLPHARVAAAESIAQEEDATAAVRFVEGSFFTDELPAGADVALLANILHNWTRDEGLLLLAKILRSLSPGGVLLVEESFFEDDWTGPMEAVFEAFLMIGREGKSGWQPTYSEIEEMMAEAGFSALERRFGLVLGRKGRRRRVNARSAKQPDHAAR